MSLYGPSAATGVGGGAAAYTLSGGELYIALAAFTLVGAVTAMLRIVPKRIRQRR